MRSSRSRRIPHTIWSVSVLDSFRPLGVIFDLDGTLTDNMSHHAEAFAVFMARHSLPPLTMDLRRRIDGKRNSEIFPMLFGREISGAEARAFEEEKEGTYREISRGRLRPIAGAARLLDLCAARQLPVAIATSAPERNVAHTLEALGFAGRFSVIARSDQVPRGKPFPDVFLHAAQLLGVPPECCLAFEDAPIGVTAARGAGMTCVAIASTFGADEFSRSDPPPHGVVNDYVEFVRGPGSWLAVSPSC
jgi:HAD superfamily hydrolase (TIGR01509 family)